MSMTLKIAGVLLAAGESKRLGFPKQLVLINEQVLIRRQFDQVLASQLDECFVVTGAHRQLCLNELQASSRSWQEIYHQEYSRGIGSSIKAAVTYVQQVPSKFDGIILCTCDQIKLSSAHLNDMIDLASKQWPKQPAAKRPIIASSYLQTLGTPLLIPQRLFSELLEIRDQQGAKFLLNRHSHLHIPLAGGELDIDSPSDLISLRAET